MPTLHLGVLVQPYQRGARGQTTADVAEILEDKYHVMGAFWRGHGDDVAGYMEQGLQQAVDALLAGTARVENPFAAAMDKTTHDLKVFLSSQEAEKVGIPGTPTQAALRGVNHRRRHPYRRSNPRRPSFIDSGLYEASMRAWITA